MDLRRRPRPQWGRQVVIPPGQEGSRVGLDLMRLQEGETFVAEPAGEELVLVLLSGDVALRTPGLEASGQRQDVWSGAATAFYLPPHAFWRLEASRPSELAICRAKSDRPGRAQRIGPEDNRSQERGSDLFQRRVVDIVADNVDADRLIVGETTNRTGHWSSYPPHKHDTQSPPDEHRMEEIYLYRIRPAQGFGFQGVYTADGSVDCAYRILNGDVVLLPRGYHPVAAAPGYDLYYLWALAGDDRQLTPRTDPDHAWLL